MYVHFKSYYEHVIAELHRGHTTYVHYRFECFDLKYEFKLYVWRYVDINMHTNNFFTFINCIEIIRISAVGKYTNPKWQNGGQTQ
jgi:hypothetical protein